MYQPFTLFKWKTKTKRVATYYVQFRDVDGRRLTPRSTGKTDRGAAFAWAMEQISSGTITKRKDIRFGDFAKDWFVWDTCDYLRRKRARDPYSRSYAEYQRRMLLRHILPKLATRRLDKLTAHDIENWLVQTKDSAYAVTANRAFTVRKIMLKEAVRQDILLRSPAETVEGLPEQRTEKGTLSNAEVQALFNDTSITEVWDSSTFHMALNAVAFTTGMRMGEIQALRWIDLGEDCIRVEHNWDRRYGLKQPKAASKRIVPLTPTVRRPLDTLRAQISECDDRWFIFHGNAMDRPIDHKAITKHLYQALSSIEITTEDRLERNLTFHGWRHTFHAVMRGRISDIDLRRITGHRTERITDHYDHLAVDLLRKVAQMIEETLHETIFMKRSTE